MFNILKINKHKDRLKNIKKRQTLNPKNSTKMSNNVTTKRPTQQSDTQRKTTFNENHMITKQRESILNTTKTNSSNTKIITKITTIETINTKNTTTIKQSNSR